MALGAHAHTLNSNDSTDTNIPARMKLSTALETLNVCCLIQVLRPPYAGQGPKPAT